MIVSVVTKPNMSGHKTRLNVLELLRSAGVLVCEIQFKNEIPADSDAVLAFGGDGTMLEAIRAIGGRDIPVLGVNLGNMGFLTAFEQDVDPQTVVDALKSGERETRSLLGVTVNGGLSISALNEVVIKTAGTRPITVDIFVDGRFVDSYHSDGVIVSSPAGSTAYALSAGGPVLAPDVDAVVIIPICAHSLHSRPLVVNASSEVRVRLKDGRGATVSVDGDDSGVLPKDGVVCVSKSPKTVTFVKSGGDSFFNKLLKKMNRWGTTSKE